MGKNKSDQTIRERPGITILRTLFIILTSIIFVVSICSFLIQHTIVIVFLYLSGYGINFYYHLILFDSAIFAGILRYVNHTYFKVAIYCQWSTPFIFMITVICFHVILETVERKILEVYSSHKHSFWSSSSYRTNTSKQKRKKIDVSVWDLCLCTHRGVKRGVVTFSVALLVIVDLSRVIIFQGLIYANYDNINTLHMNIVSGGSIAAYALYAVNLVWCLVAIVVLIGQIAVLTAYKNKRNRTQVVPKVKLIMKKQLP